MKNKNQTMILSALVAGLAVCGTNVWQARGAPVGCGAVLTANTTLQSDLDCSGAALVVGADNITVNLNGHTLRSRDGLGVGVTIVGHRGVTIKDGVIDGFQEAILAQESSDLTLQGLTIPSLSGNGTIPAFGEIAAIRIEGGQKVEIKDSSISAGPLFIGDNLGPDAILLESVRDASIKNVHVDGGFSGVNFGSCGDPQFGCPPWSEQLPSSGEVKDCTFANNWFGVILINAADVTIKDNVISGADQGIRAGFVDVLSPTNVKILGNEISGCFLGIVSWLQPWMTEFSGSMSGCLIKGNNVHNNVRGIGMTALINSEISDNASTDNDLFGINFSENCVNNVVKGNLLARNGGRGLVVIFGSNNNQISGNQVLDNGLEGITLFLGTNTGNQITDNTALGNGVWDLFHNDESTPNVWRDNIYNTKSGDDIP